jgi:hypothetical protein
MGLRERAPVSGVRREGAKRLNDEWKTPDSSD